MYIYICIYIYKPLILAGCPTILLVPCIRDLHGPGGPRAGPGQAWI